MLKGKFLIALAAITLMALAFVPLANADPVLYGYTDKPQYKPGETVTLKFWIYNTGPEAVILKNITIVYPWYSIIWGGNQTIKYSTTTALEKGQNKSETITFTIPTDGRATYGYVDFTVTYLVGNSVDQRHPSIYLNVVSSPSYGAFENMDRLLTMFTFLVVVVILGAIIVAAAIFLTMRRPEVAWKAEQKAE